MTSSRLHVFHTGYVDHQLTNIFSDSAVCSKFKKILKYLNNFGSNFYGNMHSQSTLFLVLVLQKIFEE